MTQAGMHHATIELKHIQLELQNNRYQHLRHFVGFVRKRGNADWEGVVSVAARALIGNRRSIVKEHVVPLRVIRQALCDLILQQKLGLEDIAAVLDELTHFGTITKEEDAALRRAGLTSRMPDGFDTPGHLYYLDVLSRYRHVGIVLEEGCAVLRAPERYQV